MEDAEANPPPFLVISKTSYVSNVNRLPLAFTHELELGIQHLTTDAEFLATALQCKEVVFASLEETCIAVSKYKPPPDVKAALLSVGQGCWPTIAATRVYRNCTIAHLYPAFVPMYRALTPMVASIPVLDLTLKAVYTCINTQAILELQEPDFISYESTSSFKAPLITLATKKYDPCTISVFLRCVIAHCLAHLGLKGVQAAYAAGVAPSSVHALASSQFALPCATDVKRSQISSNLKQAKLRAKAAVAVAPAPPPAAPPAAPSAAPSAVPPAQNIELPPRTVAQKRLGKDLGDHFPATKRPCHGEEQEDGIASSQKNKANKQTAKATAKATAKTKTKTKQK